MVFLSTQMSKSVPLGEQPQRRIKNIRRVFFETGRKAKIVVFNNTVKLLKAKVSHLLGLRKKSYGTIIQIFVLFCFEVKVYLFLKLIPYDVTYQAHVLTKKLYVRKTFIQSTTTTTATVLFSLTKPSSPNFVMMSTVYFLHHHEKLLKK